MEVINQEKFKEIIKSDSISVIVFSASWCMPCKRLKPIIEDVIKELSDVPFYDVDIDDSEEIVKEYQVFGVPTIVCFKNGKKIDSLVGLQSHDDIVEFVSNCKNN